MSCDKPPPGGFTLAAEFIPPPGSSVARQEIDALAFDGSWRATPDLQSRVQVQGEVVDGKGNAVSSLVVVNRPSSIDGLPPVAASALTTPDGFHFDLLHGNYDLRVGPQGAAQASFAPWMGALEVSLAAPAPKIVLSPAQKFTGRVVDRLGDGMGGVKVRAVDPLSGDLLSSVDTTDDGGVYDKLWLSAGAAAMPTVRVTAMASTVPITLSRDVDPRIARNVPPVAVELRMPALPAPQQFVIPLLGLSTSGAMTPLAGAIVVVSADVTDPGSQTTATFSTGTNADDQGRATLTLVPGADVTRRYGVTVTPVDASMFASGSFSISVGPAGGVLPALVVKPRLAVVGQIVGADGSPLAGAIVTALAAGASQDDAAVATAPQTATGSDGRFLLRVEPGQNGQPARYALDIVPPAGSGAPRWSVDNMVLTSDTDVGVVKLPPASPATVAVNAPDIEVRLYATTQGADCPQGSACPPRLRADARSGADGIAHLLVGVR
jgi:hypothetical protein